MVCAIHTFHQWLSLQTGLEQIKGFEVLPSHSVPMCLNFLHFLRHTTESADGQ
jgi:hypothetical protein